MRGFGAVRAPPAARPGPRGGEVLTGWRWGKRLDGQRVNIALQHVIHGRVNQAVPGNGGHAAKRVGYNAHAEVAVAPRSARMTGVKVTFVVDFQSNRGEPGDQPFAQTLLAGCIVHQLRSACASRVLPLSQMTCGTMKISIATLMPNTLKLTHTLSAKFRAM